MTEHKGIFVIIFVIVTTAVTFILANVVNVTNPQFAISLIVGLLIAVISFIRQDWAAITIICSMLLSPELEVVSLPNREVVIRFDDVILIVFFFSWLLRMAYVKDLSLIKANYLNLPILCYIFVALLSTGQGIINGRVRGEESLFYFLKYIEYFMVFFMFSNIIRTKEQLKKFLAAFFVTAAIVSVYGLVQIMMGVPRISAPFEGVGGEANTFGGYLLLVIGICGASLLKTPDFRKRLLYGASLMILVLVLLATYSRGSYFGFLVLIIGLLFFAKPVQRAYSVAIILVLILLSPVIMPQKVKDRVTAPFSGETEEVGSFIQLNPGDSAYLKVQSNLHVIKLWTENPILGKGITGVGLVDSQYARILGEMGILGLLSFIWILTALRKACFNALRAMDKYEESEAWQWRAVVVGFFCALLGLMFHGLAANTFIIVRIMEPFWFLAAVVVALPSIELSENGGESSIEAGKLPGQ